MSDTEHENPAGDKPGDAFAEIELRAAALRRAAAAGRNVADVPQVESAAEMKVQLQAARSQVVASYEHATELEATTRALIDAQKRKLDQMMRDLAAELAPLQKKMARFEDGIRAVQLYLGRGEEIFVVRDGQPDPAEDPVYLRQETLAMDEETVIAAGEGGIDFSDIDLFIDWLQDDEHLDQLIPERKGIVACQPRRQAKEYTGDPFIDGMMNEHNWFTYWLIRNGERVWLTKGEFVVGNTICPKESEFTTLFRDPIGRPLEPGSSAWAHAEERADRMTRHYMKVAMLLQGLVDRTAVLDPKLPGLSFINQASYELGEVIMITDSERAITTSRRPFPEWIREKREQLVEGMRVAFDPSYTLGYLSYDREDAHSNSRPNGSTPAAGIYQVQRYSGSSYFDFKFLFDRRDQIWSVERGYTDPQRRATARFERHAPFCIPVDTITVEEIDEYLGARTERKHYLKMVPLLRQARALLVQEREVQTPFALALGGRLSSEYGLDHDAAVDLAWDLVSWYRGSKKWQEPVQENDANAYAQTMSEAKRRLATARSTDRVLTAAKSLPGELLAVARRSTGFLAVFRQETEHPGLKDRPFVRIVELSAAGVPKAEREWQLLKRSQVSRWQMIHQVPEFADLELDARRGSLMTDVEIAEAIEEVRGRRPTDRLITVRIGLAERDLRFEAWFLSDCERQDKLGQVIREAGVAELSYAVLPIENSRIGRGWFYSKKPELQTQGFGARDDRETVPVWAVRYFEHVKPDQTVFTDPKVEAEALAYAQERQLQARAARAESDLGLTIYQQVRALIEAEQEAELRARYIDDYGTERGFKQYRSGLKVKARHPDKLRDTLWRDLGAGQLIGGQRLGDLYPDMELWGGADYVLPAVLG